MHVCISLQPCVLATFINPQVCSGYFTISAPLYDGDTYHAVVDRVRRISGISGQLAVTLQSCGTSCLCMHGCNHRQTTLSTEKCDLVTNKPIYGLTVHFQDSCSEPSHWFTPGQAGGSPKCSHSEQSCCHGLWNFVGQGSAN